MRTGNDDHSDWTHGPKHAEMKEEFQYDKPDVHSYRIGVWQVIFWLGIGALFTVACAAGWYWKHGGW